MWGRIQRIYCRCRLLVKHIVFQFFFKKKPGPGEFCNAKDIVNVKTPLEDTANVNLVFIRSGAQHQLIDDGSGKTFDIAINFYASPEDQSQVMASDYIISGGLNKYKAASQFLSDELLDRYESFMLLDDDLEITYSKLNEFFEYCRSNEFLLAQPSLSPDSYYSHEEMLNKANSGWRYEYMVEVMCPYFSREALRKVLPSFNLSYSTWGLDHIWPVLLNTRAVIVDEVMIKHTSPHRTDGPFYQYMDSIGISPELELRKLRKLHTMDCNV